jgi:hypothetical protein
MVINDLFGNSIIIKEDKIENKKFKNFIEENFIFDMLNIDNDEYDVETVYSEIFKNDFDSFADFIKEIVNKNMLNPDDIIVIDTMDVSYFNEYFMPTYYGFVKNKGEEDAPMYTDHQIENTYPGYLPIMAFDFDDEGIGYFSIKKDEFEDLLDDILKNYINESLEPYNEYMLLNPLEFNFIPEVIDECQLKDDVLEDLETFLTGMENEENEEYGNELIKTAIEIGFIDDNRPKDENEFEDWVEETTENIIDEIGDFVEKYYEHYYNGSLYNYMDERGYLDDEAMRVLSDYDVDERKKEAIAMLIYGINEMLIDEECAKRTLFNKYKNSNIDLEDFFDIQFNSEFNYDGKVYELYSIPY